VPSVEVKNEWR